MSRQPSDHEPAHEPTSSPRASGVGELVQGARPPEVDDEQLRRVLAALGEPGQVDLGRYRDTTVRRQVLRRMMALGDPSVDAYLERLGRSPEEARRLEESVLVAVTSFFRDPPVFDALRAWLVARSAALVPGAALRVWVPGCASGEEAYSIAMVLHDVLGPRLSELDVHVFATDADERATRFARAGVYSHEAGRNLREDERARYFSVERDQLRVAKHVRDLCVFATHDLLRQPPFRNMDLVSCRNVLIYFQREHRQDVLHKLHYALNPGGCLLLGQAESVAVQSGLFDTIDAQNKLYLRRPGPSPRLSSSLTGSVPIETMAPEGSAAEDEPPNLSSVVGRALEAAYLPASVLVDERGAVLHISGSTQRYLALPQGRGDFSIGALCIPALRGELKTLLHLLATQDAACIASQPVEVSRELGATSVRVVGRKLRLARGARAFLLSFEEREPSAARSVDGQPVLEGELSEEVLELRQELSATREHLHSLVEQLEAANDRMLSANQELQASSEEVQSANEELQATNEELLSLNEELQLKSQDLQRANDTLSSIQNSIQVALVVVDAGCHILSFNALAVRIFGLMPRDYGRSLSSVPCSLRLPDLPALVEDVVRSGEPSVHRIDDDGRHYLLQVSPYESSQRVRTGAVLAFTDVGELRRVEQESQRLFEHFRATFEQATTGIAHVSLDGRWLRVNRHWCDVLGYSEDELCRMSVTEVTHPEDVASTRLYFGDTPVLHQEIEKRYLHKDGHTVWAKVAFTTVAGGGSLPAYRVVVLQDITAERAAEERLRARERELRQVVASLPLLPLSARADGTLDFVGEQWREYLGVPTAEVSARGIASFVHPSEEAHVAERIARAVSEQAGFELTLRLRQHDGAYRWFSLRMRPLVDERGAVVRWFAAASDLHESIVLSERLEGTLEALNVTLTGASVASFNVGRRADGMPVAEEPTDVNPELWRLLRLPAELPPGVDRAQAVVHPEDVARARDVALTAMARCEPYEVSFRTAPALGAPRWMLARATPVLDADGACRRYRGVLIDITAQKEVEEQHRETLARLTRANALAGVGHFERDLVHESMQLDLLTRKMFGLPEHGELSPDQARVNVDPGTRSANAARLSALLAERATSFEALITVLLDGERRYIHTQNTVEYAPSGRPTKLFGACRDVTAEHEARVSAQLQQEALEQLVHTRTEALRDKERQLAAVLNGVPCAIGYWDVTERSRFANDAHRDWFGTSPDAMHGLTISELWRGSFARDLAQHVAAVLRGERVSYELAVEVPLAQAGEPRFAHVYFVPDGAPGHVAGFFSLVFDITSLKRAQQQADAARRAKGQFLANMSHEIRTPLTAVLGLAELGRRAAPTRDSQECFGNIQRAGRHLLAVITDILDFSRIEAGKLELIEAPVELGELLAQVVTTVAGAAHEKGLKLRLIEAAGLPRSVRTDSARVAQVMINLLSNAVKFTEQGHVQLALGYEAGQLTIAIEDTGIGIPPEIQRRLFEPFEQGVPRGGNRVGGTGLGLAICKRIVALLQGRLEITSEAGRGTTVRVSLPCEALAGPDLAAFDGTLFVGQSPELNELARDFAARGCRVFGGRDAATIGPEVRAIITDHASVGALATDAVRSWHERTEPHPPVFLLCRSADPSPLRNLPPWLGAALVAQQLPTSPLMLRVAASQGSAPDELGEEPLAQVRILAAEDQEINRVLLREMLATTGATLVCVDNGRKVVEQLEADGPEAYDVVLCDIEMPELDGYEATMAMRSLSPSLPIIGLTAHAFELARERGRAVGMTDYLTKPYTLKLLVEVIARAVGRR